MKISTEDAKLLTNANGTDLDRAEFIADHVEGKLIYVPGPEWFWWNGVYWVNDASRDGAVARRMAHDVSNDLLDQAQENGGTEFLDAARAMRSSRNITNALGELRAMPGIRREVEELDSDPFLLNFRNRTVDLRSGECREHGPADLITYAVGYEYRPDADMSRWLGYLEASQPDDPDMWEFLQRVTGYGLTGSTREECLIFNYGGGANGKGVFTETLQHIFAPVVTSQNGEFWEKARNGRNGSLVAKLHNARMVFSSEMTSARLDEAFLKAYTAADVLTANPKYKPPYDFTPVGLLVMSGNDKPTIRGTDDGIWRRFRCVPWDRHFAQDERDRNLKPDLRKPENAEGVIAWAVAGAVRWYREGLNSPERVTRATDDYREESNPFLDWIAENFEADPEGFVTNAEIKACGDRSMFRLPGSPQQWGSNVAKHFGAKTTRKTVDNVLSRGIAGVRLIPRNAPSGDPDSSHLHPSVVQSAGG